MLRAALTISALLGAGCTSMMGLGGFPPEALRKAPPPDHPATALAVGAPAPALDALPEGRSAVVAFMRGRW